MSVLSRLTIAPGRVARLMNGLREGDRNAAGELVELFYPELRRIAAARMQAERANHTWRPTALVNELYLELLKIRALRGSGPEGVADREQFLALAAHVMRRLLLNHARQLPNRVVRQELPELVDPKASAEQALLDVENALDRLGGISQRLRTVVELRVFEGLTREEIAGRLACGTATVARDWSFARQWLEVEFARRPSQ
jgi:RNA polymerase sigma factor (TIGR02999 family)